MSKAILLCAVLYFLASQATGQLVVTPFDPQRTHVLSSDPVLVIAPQGKILLRLQGLTEEEPARFWSSLYVLDQSGKVLRRIDFPVTESTLVVPYRNGFVARHYFESEQCNPPCGRYIPGRSEFVYYDLSQNTAEPVVLARREGVVDVLGTPYFRDLYLLDVESEEAQVSRITRVDENFKSVWSRSYKLLDWGSVTATDDGIVLEQQYYEPLPKYVLRAVGRDGVERWDAAVPDRVNDGIQFVPAGFLVVPASRRLSPYRVDAKTGRMLPDVDFPPSNFMVPTQDGLLLVGPMLGQSYAAMLKADGTYAWRRRFNQDSDLRTFKHGVMTSNGRLLLIAEGDFSGRFTLVSVERDGASLEKERSACLTESSPEAAAIDQSLQRRGVYVVSPNAPPVDPSNEPPKIQRNGCPSVTESQYVYFMRALASALGPSATDRLRAPQIAVRLLGSGETSRLDRYGLGIGGWSGRRVYSEFAVPYDQAQEFARVLLEVIQPHVKRMTELQEEFSKLTHIVYGANIEATPHIRQALAKLEASAAELNKRIKTMPRDKFAYVLATRPTDCVGATLTPDGFGTGYADDPFGNRPLSDAVETLVHIAELRRKSVAAGDICTIG